MEGEIQAPLSLESAPIPVTETPADPYHYFNRLSQELPTTYWEGIQGEAKLTYENLPTKALFRSMELGALKDQGFGPKLDPNDLNKRFPEVDQPFTEPMNLPAAEEIARRARDRHEMESIVGRSSVGGVGRFGTSLLVGAIDPLNLAAGILSGGALRAAGVMAEATTISRYAAQAAVEGTAGALVPEAITGYANAQEQQQYGALDYLSNVGMAGLGYAGITTGVRFGLPKLANMLRRVPEAERMSHEAAVAQLLMDRRVDVEPIAQTMVRETNGAPHPGLPEYRYEPLTDGAQARERPLYAGSTKSLGGFSEAPKAVIEEDLGHGIYLTDNPAVANGHAARTVTDADGKIFQVAPAGRDLNLLHLDSPLADSPARGALEELGVPAEGARTVKGALELVQAQIQSGKLPESALDELAGKLKAAGYDGYFYEGGKYLGESNAPHNVVMVFDPEQTGDGGGLLREQAQFAPDRSATQRAAGLSRDEILRGQSAPERRIDFDSAAVQEFNELLRQPPKELELPDLQEHDSVALETLRALQEQGQLAPEEVKALERIEGLAREAKEEETAIKAGLFCMGRDV
jgi:hypothetical protein